MMRQTELVERVVAYLPQADESLLNRAYVYAMKQHNGQTRESGEDYFTHPLEVAAIVTELKLDQESVVAALLHDTIEDTDSTFEEIERIFGASISRLVSGLTKLKRIDLVSKKARQGENLRKLLIAVADDIRVLLVKLADRLHNMRTLDHVGEERRKRISAETMDIYAPLAGRMGMQDMRDELEELAFKHLYRDAWKLVHDKLKRRHRQNEKTIAEIERVIVNNLARADIKAIVKNRSKHPYSIFRKMERNKVNFEQLSDIIGFRVIVENIEDCYRALGVVHRAWAFVPDRFKDYISTPKANDYRSIHTTIVGPSRQRVELQIRTHGMNAIAEYGIAAHTLYKDGVYRAPESADAGAGGASGKSGAGGKSGKNGKSAESGKSAEGAKGKAASGKGASAKSAKGAKGAKIAKSNGRAKTGAASGANDSTGAASGATGAASGATGATDAVGAAGSDNLAKQSRAYSWLRHTVETLANKDHPDDLLEHTKLELFFDQVFCFTPKGRLIALPHGATAIDFAFAVHTDIGMSCIGVRINGKTVPVVSKLRNGDEVHIIRSKGHIPPAAWEHIVATGKARSGIRRATREARQKQFCGLGEKILHTAFRRHGHEFERERMEIVLDSLAHASVEDALAAVGRGEMPAEDVLKAFFPDYKKERGARIEKPSSKDGWFNFFGVSDIRFRIPGRRGDKRREGKRRGGKRRDQALRELEDMIPVSGSSHDLPVKFNEECGAVPGDRIVGILTPNKGITVYPINAAALERYEETADQWLDLRWDINEENPQRFPAKVKLSAVNQPGVLAEITEVIAENDVNINNLYLTSPQSTITDMVFGIEVWNLTHLNRLIRTLRALSVVSHVERNYG